MQQVYWRCFGTKGGNEFMKISTRCSASVLVCTYGNSKLCSGNADQISWGADVKFRAAEILLRRFQARLYLQTGRASKAISTRKQNCAHKEIPSSSLRLQLITGGLWSRVGQPIRRRTLKAWHPPLARQNSAKAEVDYLFRRVDIGYSLRKPRAPPWDITGIFPGTGDNARKRDINAGDSGEKWTGLRPLRNSCRGRAKFVVQNRFNLRAESVCGTSAMAKKICSVYKSFRSNLTTSYMLKVALVRFLWKLN